MNPLNTANAYRVQLEAQAKATQQAQDLAEQAQANAQWSKERAAVSAKVIDFIGKVLDALATMLVVIIFCGGVAGGGFLIYTAWSYKKYADLQVSIIRPDKNNRMPGLVRISNGHYQVLDMGTGLVLSTLEADFRNPADVEMLRNLMMMYSANVTTQNAARAKLPQGVRASFPPPTNIIEAE
jgi:hypothetical protein